MARYTGPVCRICRREGMKLFLKGEKCFTKCTFEKRSSPPGMHQQRRRGEDRRRRRVGAELAVGGDDSRAAEAPAEPSVGRGLQVLARLFLQELPRRRRAALGAHRRQLAPPVRRSLRFSRRACFQRSNKRRTKSAPSTEHSSLIRRRSASTTGFIRFSARFTSPLAKSSLETSAMFCRS